MPHPRTATNRRARWRRLLGRLGTWVATAHATRVPL